MDLLIEVTHQKKVSAVDGTQCRTHLHPVCVLATPLTLGHDGGRDTLRCVKVTGCSCAVARPHGQ